MSEIFCGDEHVHHLWGHAEQQGLPTRGEIVGLLQAQRQLLVHALCWR